MFSLDNEIVSAMNYIPDYSKVLEIAAGITVRSRGIGKFLADLRSAEEKNLKACDKCEKQGKPQRRG
ncbi:hypothetical protein B9Q11_03570 [Candidatus Marsarchaeota G2 archaeon ECH_B_SAG-F08]|uniref:Uncharacterized protein n=1 Tax=Candidatus Marsarchaeota G2 archaeon ECH_B_SAG-F08 TaxID=1978165 RepID=A0A2R6BGG2_9ARCH|nr:MAG: hypothetical protein B9Q11_03570 [Candidatus Marsarchaeota G2 archaeon ECH_B_SAG-F08]